MKSFPKTSFPDDETVDYPVIEDAQILDSLDHDSQLSAALPRAPVPHQRDDTLVIHPSASCGIEQELETYAGQVDEDEKDTNQKQLENFCFSNKLLLWR